MKRGVVGIAAVVMGLVVVECVCRWGLGLGDPPLSVAHPTIEYMFKPASMYRRFGNTFSVNQYGMRSDELTPRPVGNEIRILVMGDSVPNGGNLTHQPELASEILRLELSVKQERPVTVGNISAGTWSPPNLLAYVEAYGTFGAHAAFIVLNGADLDDLPSFAPLDPRTHPTRAPLTATGELLGRYLWPWLVGLVGRRDGGEAISPSADARATCVGALDALIERLRADGCTVAILYHPFRHEMGADGSFVPDEAFGVIRAIAARHAVPFRSLDGDYGGALRAGHPLYRDGQHPTAEGQAVMAAAMMAVLDEMGDVTSP